jgi:hypothetical protein
MRKRAIQIWTHLQSSEDGDEQGLFEHRLRYEIHEKALWKGQHCIGIGLKGVNGIMYIRGWGYKVSQKRDTLYASVAFALVYHW